MPSTDESRIRTDCSSSSWPVSSPSSTIIFSGSAIWRRSLGALRLDGQARHQRVGVLAGEVVDVVPGGRGALHEVDHRLQALVAVAAGAAAEIEVVERLLGRRGGRQLVGVVEVGVDA